MSNVQNVPTNAPVGAMSEVDRAAAVRAATALGQAYRDAENSVPTSPFEFDGGVSRRIDVQMLTERIRRNVVSSDLGDGFIPAAGDGSATHHRTQDNVRFVGPDLNQEVSGRAANAEQVGDSVDMEPDRRIAAGRGEPPAMRTPSERITLSEVVTQLSSTQDYQTIQGDVVTINTSGHLRGLSQAEIAAQMRLAIILLEAYHEVEDPPISPFEGQGDVVSVPVNVPQVISRLRHLGPSSNNTVNNPATESPLIGTFSRTAALPIPAGFEVDGRAPSSSRDAEAIPRRSATISDAAITQQANVYGTDTNRDLDSS
ncbi:hypothetical protein FRB93_000876 [Tulasnella sp. JGI-2019a]|nr:hypothetical protein FRB93_000876 [Tulasnella sp. JGI-2019a]